MEMNYFVVLVVAPALNICKPVSWRLYKKFETVNDTSYLTTKVSWEHSEIVAHIVSLTGQITGPQNIFFVSLNKTMMF